MNFGFINLLVMARYQFVILIVGLRASMNVRSG